MSIIEEQIQRFQHACQTAIGWLNGNIEDRGECSPKHLRVGVDTALVDHGALVALLIEKGLFTLEEYQAKRLECWRKELAMRIEEAHNKGLPPGVEFG